MDGKTNKQFKNSINNLNQIPLFIQRFGADLTGMLLIALGLISFLGVSRISTGSVIDSLASWLERGFGWTAYGVVFLLLLSGIQILSRHIEKAPKLQLHRLIMLELSVFCASGLLALYGGLSVENASIGSYGGMIGWGVGRLFSSVLTSIGAFIFLGLILLILLVNGFAVEKIIVRVLDQLLEPANQAGSNLGKNYSVADVNNQETETGILAKETKARHLQIQNLSREKRSLPLMDLLLTRPKSEVNENFIHEKALEIEKTLTDFGIPVRVAGYRVGPTIIQFAVEPGFIEKVNELGDIVKKKIRVSQISSLQRDLTLALSVERLRIEAPIPGYSYVGVEIPNIASSVVRLRSVMESDEFRSVASPLALALGLDVSGNAVVTDLARMPHMLIAGTTGSGKSVCLTAFLSCLVMNNTPEQLRIAIIDPKMVEMIRFNGLPHLIGKVETDQKRIQAALQWAIKEMEERYRQLEEANARDIDSFNAKMERRGQATLPRIVIFVDELADLMMNAPEQTEASIVRLAQMARATGIHLVVATQRPSTDIVTGLIKANFPARIAFMVASSIDSRVILDTNGAETLMGKGDLLFLNPENGSLQRAQGILMDDREIEKIIQFWKDQIPDISAQTAPWEDMVIEEFGTDALLQSAVDVISKEGKASASLLQRRLRIGYPRAARLMDELEEAGFVGPAESGGKEREIFTDIGNNDGDDM